MTKKHDYIIFRCKETYRYPGNGGILYRAVIEDVPEGTQIFYKFLKYSVSYMYSNAISTDWEYLDRTQFRTDAHHHVNRVVKIESG